MSLTCFFFNFGISEARYIKFSMQIDLWKTNYL